MTAGMIFCGLAMATGCTDKAKEPYDLCVTYTDLPSDGHLVKAINYCQAAVNADPGSTLGKAAAAKLPELERMKVDQDEKAKAAAETQAKADEAAKQAAAVAALTTCKSSKDRQACSTACDAGDIPSCATFGHLAADKAGKDECLPPLQKACDANVGQACFDLAECLRVRAMKPGRGGQFTAAKGEREPVIRKACDLGYGVACCSVATDYEKENVAPFKDKCVKLTQKNCDDGDADVCAFTAILYEVGRDVPKSAKKAAALYKKACDGGSANGCRGLKAMGQ
jgi:TPR repeat protein